MTLTEITCFAALMGLPPPPADYVEPAVHAVSMEAVTQECGTLYRGCYKSDSHTAIVPEGDMGVVDLHEKAHGLLHAVGKTNEQDWRHDNLAQFAALNYHTWCEGK